MAFKKKWEFFHKNRAIETKLDYYKSVKFDKLAKKYYEKPSYVKSGDPTIMLAKTRVRLAKTQKTLDKVRNQAQLTKQQIDERWEELEKNEEAFKQSFIRFEKFIRANMEKRERGAKKLEEDRLLADKRLADTNALWERLNRYYEYKEKLENEVKNMALYENFIVTVCKNMPNMEYPMKLIQRYEMLHEAGLMFIRNQEDSLLRLENAKTDMMRLTDEKGMVIIGLNTKVFNLDSRYENARYSTLRTERMVSDIFEKACKRLSEIISVKQTIWDMYRTMCKFKNHTPTISPNNVEQLLMFIKETLLQLSKMKRGIKRSIKKNESKILIHRIK